MIPIRLTDHNFRQVFAMAVLVALVCLASVQLLQAQTTNATVSGTVRDVQGGVLPGSTVVLTSDAQGSEITVITDAQGNFFFPYVRPDTYTMKISLDGFQTLQVPKVIVNANDRLTAGSFTLQVGQVSETVTVVDRAPDIQLRSGERAYTLESAAMQNLAVNGRSFFGLAVLVPGIIPNTDDPTQVSAFNANGQRANSNNMTIDGVANIDTGDNGGNMATTNLDAVAEFKVLTSSYQAEYGRAVGAQVQVVTKSGGKDFSGSAYWYGRRSAWNANTWTNNRSGTALPKSSRNDFGYTVGGPIFIPGKFNTNKNKLFFFWNQEWQRRKDPTNEQRVTVPTALERKGDFSQSLDANGNLYPYIKDYQTNLPCSASNTSGCFRDGGVLGRIPTNRLYGPTLAALSIYPAANVSGKTGYNYLSQTPGNSPHREEMIRTDYEISNNWRVTGRYMNRSETFELPYGISGWSVGGNLDIMQVISKTPGRNWLVATTGIINATTSLEISVGSGHNSLDHSSVSEKLTRKGAGLSNLPMLYTSSIQNDYIPYFTYGGGRIGNAPVMRMHQAPFTNFNTTYDIVGNMTKLMGSHAFRWGVYYQKSMKDQSAFSTFNGRIDFNNNSNNPYDSSHPFANAALGVYDTFSQASIYAKPKWRYSNVEWFLQDNWKVNPRLTLDYGLRFYILTPQYDASYTASNWLPENWNSSKAVRLYRPAVVNGARVGQDSVTGATVNSAFIGRVVTGSGDRFNGAVQAGKGISDTLTDGNKFNVSPRFGFAFDVTGKQSVVLRGGFGIFYDRPQGNQVFDLINNPPGMQTQTLTWGLVSEMGSSATPIFSTLGLQPNVYNWKLPTVYQWNLGMQVKLPHAFTFDAAYVGSESRNLLQYRNLNAIPYGTGYAAAAQDPTRGQSCSGCSASSALPGGNALPNDFLRPYQGFGDIRLWEFEAYSNYKALQLTISRRFQKGLMFSFNYSRAEAKGTLGGDWDYARIDGRDKEANYGPLSFNRPHTYVASFVYEIPGVTSGPAKFIAGGWQISGNYRWLHGTPANAAFSIPGIGNINLTGSGTEGARIALTGAEIDKGWSKDPYNQFNVAAFTAPKQGSIGLESPRYTMSNPPTSVLDLSLSKQFRFTEKQRFEIRLDAFNALNAVNFSGVNRTLNFASLTDSTITNLPYNSSGKLTNQNGVGTISGVRAPRQLQLVCRFYF